MTNSGQRQPTLLALGDAAVLIEFADHLDLSTNTRIQVLAQAIRNRRMPWIRDVVPALATLAVHVDPVSLGFADPIEPVRNLLNECLNEGLTSARPFKQVHIPICYETEFGLDLDDISQRTGLSVEQVVQRHQHSEFMVLMVGFAPGHPYLGGLAPSLSVPRRSAPRVKMPCGAVAVCSSSHSCRGPSWFAKARASASRSATGSPSLPTNRAGIAARSRDRVGNGGST